MKNFKSYINESLTLQYHDELNPVFWENDKLKPEIRNHLLYIAKFWQEFAKIPNSIVEDIILVGGNANYNYTEHSDLDIHFVIHKDQMEASPEFVDEYLKDKKELWSKIHDVKVKGHDVELYAQDINAPYQKDQGVYSLKNDEWLVHPNHVRVDYDNPHLLHKIDHLKHRIDDLISGGANEFSFKTLKDKIKNMRVAGLKKSGEFSYENLVFKELRNSGYLDRMNDHMDQIQDASLSLNEFKVTTRKPASLVKKVALGLAATAGTILAAQQTGTAIGTSLKQPKQPNQPAQIAKAPTVHPRNANPLGQVQTQVNITPEAKAPVAQSQTKTTSYTPSHERIGKLLNAFSQAEHRGTGVIDFREFNPTHAIRTKAGGGKSSAWGVFQITGTTARDYATRMPHLFSDETREYALRFADEGKKMINSPNNHPTYGLGRPTPLANPDEHHLYLGMSDAVLRGMGKDMGIDLTKELNDKDLAKITKRFRGLEEKKYLDTVREHMK